MGEAGRQRVVERFTWDASAQHLAALIDTVPSSIRYPSVRHLDIAGEKAASEGRPVRQDPIERVLPPTMDNCSVINALDRGTESYVDGDARTIFRGPTGRE